MIRGNHPSISRHWMSETKLSLSRSVSDWWSRGVFLIYSWELRTAWRWFNMDLITCLFSESRLESHPSLSLSLSLSQNITTGNAKIQIKHRREDGDKMTSDKWCGRRYFGLKLIHQRRLSPNIFTLKYIWVTWPGNSFLLPWQCNMPWACGLTSMIISIIMKCFMKRWSTPKISGTRASCY